MWIKFDPNAVYCWFWSPAVGRSGGLLCGIKSSRFDVLQSDTGRFFVKVVVSDRKLGQKFSLIVVYGVAQERDEADSLIELAGLCSDQSLPLLLGGDFNILRHTNEKNKKGGVRKHSEAFNSIINTHALREVHMSSGSYTWSNRQDIPTLEKLDRILMSDGWETLFPLTCVRKIPRAVSDHNPLTVDIGEDLEMKSRDFRFESN